MDDILFYVGLFVIWVVSQFLAGKKKKKQTPQKSRPVDSASGPTTLEEALREIQQALNPTPQPEQTPPSRQIEPVVRSEQVIQPPRPRPIPVPARVPEPVMAYENRFENRPQYQGERFTSLERIPVREDRFEARSTFKGDLTETGSRLIPTSLSVEKNTSTSTGKTRNVVNLRQMDTRGLQKAFVLGTILGLPKSKQRHS